MLLTYSSDRFRWLYLCGFTSGSSNSIILVHMPFFFGLYSSIFIIETLSFKIRYCGISGLILYGQSCGGYLSLLWIPYEF